MPSPPSTTQRSALPLSFFRPSSPSPSSPDRSIGVALDGSFVETTSETAARAIAQYYAQQAGGDEGKAEFGVIKFLRDGKTVYRIRPIDNPDPSTLSPASTASSLTASTSASPSSPTSPTSTTTSSSSGYHPFARPSHAPAFSPSPAPALIPSPTIAVHRSSVQPRSFVQPGEGMTSFSNDEQADYGRLLSPDRATFSSHPSSSSLDPTPACSSSASSHIRRAGSSPSLSAAGISSFSSRSAPTSERRSRTRPGSSSTGSEGDVLGRILGWREGMDEDEGGLSRGGSRRSGRKVGSARMEVVPVREGAALEEGEEEGGKEMDMSDLPEDPVLEALDAASAPVLPFALPPRRPSFARTNTSPFGAGVKGPRLEATKVERRSRSDGLEEEEEEGMGQRHMREVSSNDSIRTARASSTSPKPSSPTAVHPPRRFEDPAVFDVFSPAGPPPQPPLPSSPPPASANPPLFQHTRLASSTSLASVASNSSDSSHTPSAHQITISSALHSAGDDPRFAIWGYRDSSPSSSSSPGAAAAPPPTSPPPPPSRRGSAATPASPPPPQFPHHSHNLRRESIVEEDEASSASASPATTSTRWSLGHRTASGGSSTATSVRDSLGSAVPRERQKERQKILMAATVERLVAELTSEISSDLLADFFLTYRHYLAPLDLLRLLLTRFDWSIASPSATVGAEQLTPAQMAEAEALRRVVRVRTWSVLRYWLLNHFLEDFYPSREMRTLLTSYLNEAAKSEEKGWRREQRDLRLIKQLKKAVRKCKETYVVGGGAEGRAATAEEDVDLEDDPSTSAFPLPASAGLITTPPPASSFSFASLRGAGPRARAKLFPPSSSTSASAYFSGPSSSSFSPDPHSSSREHDLLDSFPLPGSTAKGPLGRSFVSALGTFGRIKRRMKAGKGGGGGGGGGGGAAGEEERNGSGLELERGEEGDLLWVTGGVERFLESLGIKTEVEVEVEEVHEEEDEEGEGTPALVLDEGTPEESGSSSEYAATPRPPQLAAGSAIEVNEKTPVNDDGAQLGLGLGIIATSNDAVTLPAPVPSSVYSFPPKLSSLDTAAPPTLLPSAFDNPPPSSLFSLDATPAPAYTFTLDPSLGAHHLRPQSARIELDDLDDSSDDDPDVIEVKQTLKRLPGAQNLRLVADGGRAGGRGLLRGFQPRRSMESERSYGFGLGAPWQHDGHDFPRESVLFVDDEEGYEAGVAVIPNFVLEGLVDSDEDEDDEGGVEAALRRLEGLVDSRKEREKARRVERQMEKSERLEEKIRRREEGEDEGEDEDEGERSSVAAESRRTSNASSAADEPSTLLRVPEVDEHPEAALVAAASAIVVPHPPSTPEQTSRTPVGYSTAESPPLSRAHTQRSPPANPSSTFRKPSISRILARPFSARPAAPAVAPLTLSPTSAGAGTSSSAHPPMHRSFLLYCRTEILAQQFTLIERDMLRMVSYQDLISGSWRDQVAEMETDVLDWEQYLKERRRGDVEAKERGEAKRSAVQDVIARFNLTANWTASEVLLTANIDERALLLAKLIRLAFKCYCQHNFATLTQIIHGLQIPHIERLKKTWSKVPAWEMRKYRGLQEFVSHLKNFKHLREVSSALVAEHGSSSPDLSAGAVKGCIPFLGIFLRDLALNAELPTFLDPSSPSHAASVTPSGSFLSLISPSAFSSLPPLPPSLALAPLVNIHKFRVLASTVNRVLAFQDLAQGGYRYEPVPSVYLKVLKIRSLGQGVMAEVSRKLEA